jgi:hypothetical protein
MQAVADNQVGLADVLICWVSGWMYSGDCQLMQAVADNQMGFAHVLVYYCVDILG